jgi:PII-like signaling protein
MVEQAIKLTAYLSERDRTNGRLLADALIDLYERHEVRMSTLLRGIEGFGRHHQLQTERLLTLSEDLPLVAIAVDAEARMEGLVNEVRRINAHGILTLERAQILTGPVGPHQMPSDSPAVKLTVYVGRQERAGGRPAHLAVVDLLHRHGVAGATVLLGVDGTAHGVRQRARLLSRNAQVPLLIVSVGEAGRVEGLLPELAAVLTRPVLTLERARVCKRDGALLDDPHVAPGPAGPGNGSMQKLTVYAGEQARHDGRLLYSTLIRRLREEGASGATALRGLWGYHGDHRPHGERFVSARRHVPVITVLLDTPANVRRWFEIVDEMTQETGLVTSETVPELLPAPAS